MQTREKILAAAFASIVVVWFVVPALWHGFFDEIETQQGILGQRESALENKDFEEIAALGKQRKLGEWKAQSLPANENDARRVYLQWITDLAESVFTDEMEVAFEPSGRSRDKSYTAIRVSVRGEATLDQVRDFQYRFNQASLLQRVVSVRLNSDGNRGNPVLETTLVVEGLALAGSKHKGDTLFPRTVLTAATDESAKSIEVADAAGFPKKTPFRVRVGTEYLTVTKVAGTKWTVERAIDFSLATEHDEEAAVELAMLDSAMQGVTPNDFETIVKANPFAIPSPPRTYEARQSKIGNQTVMRGETLKKAARVYGHDPAEGEPVFRLAEGAPAGMQLDEKSGELVWSPDDDQKSGDYKVRIDILLGKSDEPRFTEELTVTLKDPNHAPEFAEIEPQTAIQGRETVFSVKATDADGHELSYVVDGDKPEGLELDEKSGELRWTVGEATEVGSIELKVKVTDNGSPSESATQTLTINVIEDLARFTYLIGAVARDGEREAWLFDRKNNKDVKLKEGDPLDYAGVAGLVLAIDKRSILLQVGADTWRLGLGQNLDSMEKIELGGLGGD